MPEAKQEVAALVIEAFHWFSLLFIGFHCFSLVISEM